MRELEINKNLLGNCEANLEAQFKKSVVGEEMHTLWSLFCTNIVLSLALFPLKCQDFDFTE